MFTNRWKRTEDLEEDEWFIPYKRRSAPQARIDQPQGGVGEMPNTTSTSVNMARPTRSFFGSGSGGSGSGSGSSHRRQKSTPIEDDSATRSRFFRRPVLPRSGSDGSLTRPSPLAIPSTTSVPTGLAAPKMLFSPMMREIRDDTRPAAQYDNNHPPPSFNPFPTLLILKLFPLARFSTYLCHSSLSLSLSTLSATLNPSNTLGNFSGDAGGVMESGVICGRGNTSISHIVGAAQRR